MEKWTKLAKEKIKYDTRVPPPPQGKKKKRDLGRRRKGPNTASTPTECDERVLDQKKKKKERKSEVFHPHINTVVDEERGEEKVIIMFRTEISVLLVMSTMRFLK